MAEITLSPNMNLPVPNVGVAPGPNYAIDEVASFNIIDAHNHSSGSGVQITPAGLNINADFAFNNNNLITARSIRFQAQASTISLPTDLGCLYEAGVDLYFNDGLGNQIRLTQGGSIAGTSGSIANLVSPASVVFNNLSGTFIFQQDANKAGNLDAGSVIIRNTTTNGKGVTVTAATALAADYTLTLPTIPASTLPVTIDTSGNLVGAQITLAQLTAAVAQALNPTGTILAYGGASTPAGYLFCDGAAVSRTTYAALFAAIGTAWGEGDGSTTFKLPTLAGIFLRGAGLNADASTSDPDGAGRIPIQPGGNSGYDVGSYQGWQNEAHSHVATSPPHDHTSSMLAALATPSGGNPYGAAASLGYPGTVLIGTTTTAVDVSVQNSGGNQSNPVNVYVNYIIKI